MLSEKENIIFLDKDIRNDYPDEYISFLNNEIFFTPRLSYPRAAIFTFLFINRHIFLNRKQIFTGLTNLCEDYRNKKYNAEKTRFGKLYENTIKVIKLKEKRITFEKTEHEVRMVIEKEFERRIAKLIGEADSIYTGQKYLEILEKYKIDENTEDIKRIKQVYVDINQYYITNKRKLRNDIAEAVLVNFKNRKSIFIRGIPGSGKSATAIKLSLALKNKLNITDIYYFNCFDNYDNKIVDSLNKLSNAIIILDDIFGKYTFKCKENDYEAILGIINNNYVIITCDHHIFHDAENKKLINNLKINIYDIAYENHFGNIINDDKSGLKLFNIILNNHLNYYMSNEQTDNLYYAWIKYMSNDLRQYLYYKLRLPKDIYDFLYFYFNNTRYKYLSPMRVINDFNSIIYYISKCLEELGELGRVILFCYISYDVIDDEEYYEDQYLLLINGMLEFLNIRNNSINNNIIRNITENIHKLFDTKSSNQKKPKRFYVEGVLNLYFKYYLSEINKYFDYFRYLIGSFNDLNIDYLKYDVINNINVLSKIFAQSQVFANAFLDLFKDIYGMLRLDDNKYEFEKACIIKNIMEGMIGISDEHIAVFRNILEDSNIKMYIEKHNYLITRIYGIDRKLPFNTFKINIDDESIEKKQVIVEILLYCSALGTINYKDARRYIEKIVNNLIGVFFKYEIIIVTTIIILRNKENSEFNIDDWKIILQRIKEWDIIRIKHEDSIYKTGSYAISIFIDNTLKEIENNKMKINLDYYCDYKEFFNIKKLELKNINYWKKDKYYCESEIAEMSKKEIEFNNSLLNGDPFRKLLSIK